MKRLLWLYDDLLDLCGDGGNMTVLCARLKEAGVDFTLERKSVGDEIDFTSCDLVYIGTGMFSNLCAAAADLTARRSDVLAAVERGCVFLVTGSGCALLGKELFSADGERHKGLGLVGLTYTDSTKIRLQDVLGRFEGERVVGFVNSTLSAAGDPAPAAPLFTLDGGGTEGLRLHNLFATSFLGPMLVRNPGLLRRLLTHLCGPDFPDYDDAPEREAQRRVLEELKG